MSHALSSVVVAGALALTLGACADMQWTKAGADTAAVSRDLEQCRASALRGAAPAAAAMSQDAQVVDRAAAPIAGRPAGTTNERFVAEHEDTRRCMVSRGYQLTRSK